MAARGSYDSDDDDQNDFGVSADLYDVMTINTAGDNALEAFRNLEDTINDNLNEKPLVKTGQLRAVIQQNPSRYEREGDEAWHEGTPAAA